MFKGFLSAALLLFVAAMFYGCGDSGSTDTTWIQSNTVVLKGIVMTEDNGPAEGALVAMSTGEPGNIYTAEVDEDGRFTVYSLERGGTYNLVIDLPGYELYTTTVTMNDGQSLGTVTLVREPEPQEVSGRVVLDIEDDQENVIDLPVTDLAVAFTALTTAKVDEDSIIAELDEDGNYNVELEPGAYSVEVIDAMEVVLFNAGTVTVDGRNSVTVPDITITEDNLAANLIYGNVTYVDGEPVTVADAIVTLTIPQEGEDVQPVVIGVSTNEDGNFFIFTTDSGENAELETSFTVGSDEYTGSVEPFDITAVTDGKGTIYEENIVGTTGGVI